MEIRFLSHGSIKTGGYRHELFLAQTLEQNNVNHVLKVLRKPYDAQGARHLKLQWWGFKNTYSEMVVVGGRLALVALLRNVFSRNRIYIVLHHFDTEDGKSTALQLYYASLFHFLSCFKKRVQVIAVSPYFQAFFQQKLERDILLFPNFFDTQYLSKFSTTHKKKLICLGQWSKKNSAEIFVLAELLTRRGYECYFSSLNKDMAGQKEHYKIICFETYESYLQPLAECIYTIAFPAINEGWNRIAHESILVGTTAIGFKKGGLGNLLVESNMLSVHSAEEALALILSDIHPKANQSFIEKYDIAKAPLWLRYFPA